MPAYLIVIISWQYINASKLKYELCFQIMFQKKIKFIYIFIIISLFLTGIYNAVKIGLSWDELSHYKIGKARFDFILSLFFFEKTNFNQAETASNNYPGIYDTFTYLIGWVIQKIDNIFFEKYFIEIRHLINFFFSILGLIGLYKFCNLHFNKLIASISTIFAFINPFYFGHMSMNPKDNIIFFAFIWFLYFLSKYLFEKKDKFKNLLFLSLFLGIGCGIRISFPAICLPVFIISIYYIINNYYLFQRKLPKIFIDIFLLISVVFFLTSATWPQILTGGFDVLIETLINSLSWNFVPHYGLINGSLYEVNKTPKLYFFYFLSYRMPIYLTILIIFSYLIIFKEKQFANLFGEKIKVKFIILNIIILFPIFLAIILKVNIYDNIRLFLFLIPLLCIMASLSFVFLYSNFKNSFKSKIILSLVVILLFLSITRFFILNPYQYSYVNYSFIKLKNANNKFENDYWATSFKETVNNMEKKFTKNEIQNMKISYCGGNPRALLLLLNKKYGVMNIFSPNNANYVIMTNRASFTKNDKRTCFEKFKGEDVILTERGGLILSVLRKLD